MKKKQKIIIGTMVFLLLLISIIFIFGVQQTQITSNIASGYSNFQVNGQQSIIYSNPVDNTNSGFTNIHFLEDGGKQMCSRCQFSNRDTKWTTATGFLMGDFSSTTRYRICQGECESFQSVSKTMNCEVSGVINLLCSKSPVRSDRCESINHRYSFTGLVSYDEGNGFVCNILGAKEQLLEELPKTFVSPLDNEIRSVSLIGFGGVVTFNRIVPECSKDEEKCLGTKLQKCVGLLWEDVGEIIGKCGFGCQTDLDCPKDIEVNIFCKNGRTNTNFVDNFCDLTTNSCEKKAKVVISDLEIGKCNVECFLDLNCKPKEKQNSFCDEGTLNINYNIEICENHQCVPDIFTETSREVGTCNLDCNDNSQCAGERVTGKYWKDKSLYYDVINQICSNNICTDVVEPIFLNEKFETSDIDIDAKITLWTRILNWFKKWF